VRGVHKGIGFAQRRGDAEMPSGLGTSSPPASGRGNYLALKPADTHPSSKALLLCVSASLREPSSPGGNIRITAPG
jgi:hypothetical protein